MWRNLLKCIKIVVGMNISAVILTRNNQNTLERTLKSVSFAKEILLIDDNSTDNTKNLAKQYGARIFNRKLNNNFSQQRNFGLKEAREDWVLFIDSDEELSNELIEEIKINNNQKYKSFYIKRRDIFWGRVLKNGDLKRAYAKGILRLIKKDSGNWTGLVHERFITKKPTGTLNGYLNHYSHNSIKEFINDINNYSTIRAKELQKKGIRTNIFQILIIPIVKFKYNYLIKGGFLDGVPGFIYSFMMSFHSFLVRAKLYQYTKLSN